MVADKKIVAIIPARGGSKGIPNKNLMDICGKPLVAWSVIQAKHAASIHEVYVSSDSEAILGVASQYGARPIRRPDELANDTMHAEPAVVHALDFVRNEVGDLDYVLLMQPTSPVRESKDIDDAVNEIVSKNADSLFSARELHDFFLWEAHDGNCRGVNHDPNNRKRRQGLKPTYLENGSIYLFKPEVLQKHNNRLGGNIAVYVMPDWKSVQIDSLEEAELCRYHMERNGLYRPVRIERSGIDLIVYDFDGVMTDNRVLVSQDGKEMVFCNRADGLGVGLIRKIGIEQIILSTETNPVVKARGEKVKLHVIHGVEDKRTVLENYCKEKNVDPARVLYVGNDVNDLEAMRIVGYSVCPSDAHPDILKESRIRLASRGGEGVVRELAGLINVTEEK